MGQMEIMKILKEDKWIKGVDLAKKLKQSISIVNRSLRKLYNQGNVLRREYKIYPYSRGYEWRLK